MDTDVLIIGAGHNGLVCAFYLAKAGLKVRMLERRSVVGGAAVTEEFHPGFRNSVASYTVSLLQPRIIADMGLAQRGLRILERPIANFLPLDSGYIKIGGGLERTQAEVARFSPKDAAALPGYYAMLDGVADVLRDMALKTPPNAGGGLIDLWRGFRQGRRLATMSLERQRDVLDLFAKSARDVLDGWFESDPIKAAFGFDAIVGNFASPDTPGSAYVLLHHVFGEVNGKRGQWGHAVGGMGAITQAMVRACTEAGVNIEVDSGVRRVVIDDRGQAQGVETQDGRMHRARLVVANVGPKLLFGAMVDEAALPEDFARRMKAFRVGSATFRMNVALSELPRFSALPSEGEHHRSGIVIAPSLAYMDRAYLDAKRDGWSARPIVEMLIPSTMDDTLAPPSAHVASLFCQHFAPTLPDGRRWCDERDAAADLIIRTVDDVAPGFARAVIARTALSPFDLEERFGLIGGDIFHGAMSLDQLWSARPVLGAGAYATPIFGLWMCGAGTHPGGGVTGAPGYNAAREILRERGR